MKKTLFLLFVLVLAACDKPTSVAELTCNVDEYWQRVNVLYLNGRASSNHHDTPISVKVATYDNHAMVTVDDITISFEKVKETKPDGEFGGVHITYKGNFPGSERTALLRVYANISDKQILQYDVTFLGEKERDENGEEFSVGHTCYPVKEEYKGKSWSAAVPFNHNYKMPNKIERCITDIVQKVICENEECNQLSVRAEMKHMILSQENAMLLSKNWDYSDMKFYANDGKLEEHEMDACEVLDRLNKFIYDNDLDSHRVKVIKKAMDDCDNDDCRVVIATGELGDFLIQLPETEELREIANEHKNAKFLSVFNPNSYSKSGYCLVNVVPYNTMKKLGTPDNDCHYRIYCGSPDYMNYDENYAVEVCGL